MLKIQGKEKLTEIFGDWPRFHDARVKRVTTKDFPLRIVVVTIHVYKITQDVDANGFFILQNHTLVTMTFNGVENLKLEIPSSGMLLFGLSIDTLAEMENQHHFTVDFEDAVGDGFTLNFKCRQIEVLEVERCDSRGERYKP